MRSGTARSVSPKRSLSVTLAGPRGEPGRIHHRAGRHHGLPGDRFLHPHSVTSDDGSFDSSPGCSATATDECLQAGQTFTFKFGKIGRYPYHSKTSGGPGGEGTSGTIVVVKKGEGVSTSSVPK